MRIWDQGQRWFLELVCPLEPRRKAKGVVWERERPQSIHEEMEKQMLGRQCEQWGPERTWIKWASLVPPCLLHRNSHYTIVTHGDSSLPRAGPPSKFLRES